MLYPTPIAKLIDSYSKLPGRIKTATRLAFYTIGMSDDDVAMNSPRISGSLSGN